MTIDRTVYVGPLGLLLRTGRWWEIGFRTDHLMVIYGWSFVRYRIGIEIGYGKQTEPAPYLKPYRRSLFIPLSKVPGQPRR